VVFTDFCSRLVRRQFGGLLSVRAHGYGSKHSKAGRRGGAWAQKKIGCGFLEVLESEVLLQAIPFKSQSLLEIAWRSCVEAENLF